VDDRTDADRGVGASRHDLSPAWSPWVPLQGAGRDPTIPTRPGLYRIRSVETGRILYVGQTGRSLRGRMSQLNGVFGDVMPYGDPHTVGPALWAHRVDTGETFEVSVAVVEGEKGERLGREALEITKRRMIDGHSPAYNFGRMPRGWIRSSGNSQKLVAAGKRFRGRRMTAAELAALPPDPSVPPPVTLDGDVRARDWMGLAWRSAEREAPQRDDRGIYRIGQRRTGPLDYLGQGLVKARWEQHAKGWALDLAAERTGDSGRSVWDWSRLDLSARQLLEVENDLIAGHVHAFARPPRVQFGGPQFIDSLRPSAS
jgi:hypothetical protein